MQVDKTTLQDISIFHRDEEQSVFYRLNHAQTNGGREQLRRILAKPLSNIPDITDTQATIKKLMEVQHLLPTTITNGTIMVLQTFFDSVVSNYSDEPNQVGSLVFKLLSNTDYTLIKYSATHFIGFIKDLDAIVGILIKGEASKKISTWCDKITVLLSRPALQKMLHWEKDKKLSPKDVLWAGSYLKKHFREHALELIHVYDELDAYNSLATASIKHRFVFPGLIASNEPFVNAKGLYHLLLDEPVSYEVELSKQTNFMFLTGANMAGKSTFIKSVGICVYLAHIGMAVPVESMELSVFDGLLTNIQVEDNIIKGESYFFNEVQRIKRTVEKINDGKKWLILIDELFKGTNVQDAMKCSITVIEGLRRAANALFILSTHLYEIASGLSQHQNINFSYFETSIMQGQLVFSYQLLKGVSNDRLGYLILQREGVIEILEKL